MARETGAKRRIATLGSFAQKQLGQRVDCVLDQLTQARSGLNVDRVHDLRVAIRRLREALRVFGPLGAAEHSAGLVKRLKAIMDAAACARDFDIAIDLAATAGLTSDGPLTKRFRAARKEAEAELEKLVERASKPKFAEQIRALPELREDQTPLHSSASSLLATLARDYFAAGRKSIAAPTPARLHQHRLRTKHLRYTFELFVDLAPETVERQLEELRAVQQLLGEINDCAVTLEHAGRGREGKVLSAYLKSRLADLTARFEVAWGELEKCESHWIDSLRAISGSPAA